MNLIDKYLEIYAKNPAAPVVIEHERTITRSDLLRLTVALSQSLNQQGLTKGDIVGVALGQTGFHLATILALARLGCISLPLAQNSTVEVKARLMQRFGAKRIIAPQGVQIPASVERINLGEIKFSKSAESLNLHFIDYWPDENDPARIGLTSGTMGNPNAVLYSHRYWLQRINSTFDGCDKETRILPSHLGLTLGNLAAFAAIFNEGLVIFNNSPNVVDVYASIIRYSVNYAITTPASLENMITMNRDEGIAFPSMRQLRVLGGAVSARQLELARMKLTPNLTHVYGLSEVGIVSYANKDDLLKHPEFSGHIKPENQVEIIGDNGEILPIGQSGEIRVKISNMHHSYLDNDTVSKEKFKDGWFYTKDVGFITEDGLIRIEGRLDNKINIAGGKFFPETVEAILMAHPQIQDAAVFAKMGPEGVPILNAIYQIGEETELNESLETYCKGKLKPYMVPKVFTQVQKVPRNQSGKINRTELPKTAMLALH